MSTDWLEAFADALVAGQRDLVTESSSAGGLLPVAPVPKPPVPREAKVIGPHAFRGSDPAKCSKCDQPAYAEIHRTKGKRAYDSGPTDQVKDPHEIGGIHRDRNAKKAAFNAHADEIEPKFTDEMSKLFSRQETDVLKRLKGRKRGGFRDQLRAEPPPENQPPPTNTVFDPSAWAAETAKTAIPLYTAAASLSRDRVRQQLGPAANNVDEKNSLATVTDIMAARAKRMGNEVSQTTHKAIQDQLSQGTAAGENINQLADRVRHVFDVASKSRATMIARTETIGALNESAHGYAAALPRTVVARKEWLAHKDSRTRTDHRLADGQKQPIDQKFHVGGSLMQFPGDPTAPSDEVINCRCSLAFLPAVATGTQEAA